MKNLLEKNSSFLKKLEESYSQSANSGYTRVSAAEFYWNLANDTAVPIEDLEEGMTYRVQINNNISCGHEDSNLEGTDFYYVTGKCVKIFKYGGETLLAKFDIKGGDTLVRGNYGLNYYCTNILH